MKKAYIGRSLLTVAVLTGCWIQAYAWGQKGHDTVTAIAEKHLTPAAKTEVDSLLDGMSIVYWANWLDNASHTPEYAYSKTWHYKNIDTGLDYESAPLNDNGDIVRAVQSRIEVLKDASASKDEKVLALKMLVHLLGDMHQPMHLGHLSDLGGNRWAVKYFNRDKNLHGVWDSDLVESAHKWSYTEWVYQIDRTTPSKKKEILYGTPDDWAKETFTIATDVYDSTPEGTNISYDYIAKWTPTIENQFLKGGLRLADILNALFDPDYTPQTQAVR